MELLPIADSAPRSETRASISLLAHKTVRDVASLRVSRSVTLTKKGVSRYRWYAPASGPYLPSYSSVIAVSVG